MKRQVTTMSGSGGGNLKSTRRKINFAIDNKTFERTIYIDTNGVEYIKYNKKFVKLIKNK